MTKQKIKDAFEELLRGYCCCNFITKKTMRSYLSNMNKWLKTAKNGDTYYFDGHAYTLTTEYGIVVWRNAVQREKGEPTYMTPITSTTDLEAMTEHTQMILCTTTIIIRSSMSGAQR